MASSPPSQSSRTNSARRSTPKRMLGNEPRRTYTIEEDIENAYAELLSLEEKLTASKNYITEISTRKALVVKLEAEVPELESSLDALFTSFKHILDGRSSKGPRGSVYEAPAESTASAAPPVSPKVSTPNKTATRGANTLSTGGTTSSVAPNLEKCSPEERAALAKITTTSRERLLKHLITFLKKDDTTASSESLDDKARGPLTTFTSDLGPCPHGIDPAVWSRLSSLRQQRLQLIAEISAANAQLSAARADIAAFGTAASVRGLGAPEMFCGPMRMNDPFLVFAFSPLYCASPIVQFNPKALQKQIDMQKTVVERLEAALAAEAAAENGREIASLVVTKTKSKSGD